MTFGAIRSRIEYKLGIILVLTLTLVLSGLILFYEQSLNRIALAQAERVQLLNDLRDDLRATVFDLQNRYLAIPQRLEADPVVAVDAFARERGASEVIHEGRDALVARYQGRTKRRDLQRPGRFVVEPADGGASISYGLFQGEDYQDRIREWVIAGADAEALEAEIARIAEETGGADALERKVLELKNALVDEALEAETTRNAIVEEIEKIEAMGRDVDALVERTKTLTLALGALVGIAALLLVFFVVRSVITSALGRLATALAAVSAGEEADLRDARRTDEIGTLARGIRGFEESLHETAALRDAQERERLESQARLQRRLSDVSEGLEEGMRSSVSRVTQGSEQLAAAASELHGLVEGTRGMAGDAAERAQVSSEEAKDTVDKAHVLQDVSQDISGQVRQQRALTAAVAGEAQEAADLVGNLTETAKQIDEIVEIIDDIAGRTTLLALNATIEASHAGAAGKGFAIVAEEVKKLAVETSGTTRGIRERIAEIQSATARAAETVGGIRDRVGQVDESMGMVVDAVGRLETAAAEISTRLESGADIAEGVSRTTSEMATGAERASSMSDRMSQSAGEILETIRSMRTDLAEVLAAAADNADAAGRPDPGTGPNPDLALAAE